MMQRIQRTLIRTIFREVQLKKAARMPCLVIHLSWMEAKLDILLASESADKQGAQVKRHGMKGHGKVGPDSLQRPALRANP